MPLRLDRAHTRRHLLFLHVLFCVFWQGVSHGQNQRYVYVGNWDPSSESISGFSADPATGLLTPLAGFPVKTHGQPQNIAAHPNNKFLYASNESIGEIDAYSIDPTTGALTPISGSPFSTGAGSFRLILHPSGRFLYLCTLNNRVFAYAVDGNTGSLTPLPGSPFASQGTTHADEPASVTTDPAGKFLFVPNDRSNTVTVYSIDSTTGALTFVPGSPFQTGNTPYIGSTDPSGRFFYLANLYSNDISAYTIGATGTLTAIPGSPFPTGPYPGLKQGYPPTITVDRNGRFAYAMNEAASTIAIYRIDPTTGSLTPTVGSPFPTGSVVGPYAFAFSPEGNFAYVSFEQTGNIALYSVNSTTGELTQVPDAIFPTGTQPESIAIVNAGPPPLLTPNHGSNSGQVTVQINGVDVVPETQVALKFRGQADILATDTLFVSSSSLSARFDLTGVAPGSRDVVTTNPGESSVVLSAAFTVNQGGAPDISINMIGPGKVRFGHEHEFYLTVNNGGELDASGQVVSLFVPDPLTVEAHDGLVFDTYRNTQGTVFSYGIPQITAGSTIFIDPTILVPPLPNPLTLTLRGQLSPIPINNNLPPSPPTGSGNLLFGPTLDDTCPQPVNTCSLCSTEWASYEGAAKIAKSTASSFADAQKQCVEEQALVSLYIAKALGVSSGLALITEYIGAGLIAAGLSASEAASVTSIVGPLLSLLKDLKVEGLNEPSKVAQNLANAIVSIGQDEILEQKIKKSNGVIKSKILQDQNNAFLYGLGLVQDAIKAFDEHKEELQSAVDNRNQARTNYDLAKKNACTAVDSYLQCASSRCGSIRTYPLNSPADNFHFPLQTVGPLDPNEKDGPVGIGPAQYISGQQALPYIISFENSQSSTAPAQTVVVTDSLDGTKVNLSSVVLGPIAISGQEVTPPTTPLAFAPFERSIDLRPATNSLVKVNASLVGALLMWKFTSIDPSTGIPPTDELAGFLAPGAGGSLSFSVVPQSSVTTGTTIQNQAAIVFDTNPPINTPIWFNSFDKTAPASHVLSLPSIEASSSFAVAWGGTDVGSGVQDYTIYASDDGAAFTPWLANTTASSATYSGQFGHTYSFFSVARDSVGNVEPLKAIADNSTRISAAIVTTTTTLSSSNLNSNLNSSITLTAAVVAASGSPNGTVTFFEGGTVLGTGTLNGGGNATATATFSTGELAAGSHTITATYLGANDFSGSTSAAIIQTVTAPALLAALVPQSVIIFRRSIGTSTLTLTPVGGFSSTVTLACGTLPPHLSCAFEPSSLSLAGSNAQSSKLVISTLGSAAFALPSSHSPPTTPPIFIADEMFSCVSFYGFVAFRRRLSRKQSLRLLVFLTMVSACGAVGLVGCGSGDNIAAAGNYVIPVNITASGRTSTENLTVVVE